jgi:uncharacterized protein DUF4154
MARKLRLLQCCAAVLLAVASGAARAEVSEAAIKAAYLYKMAAFVTWPPAAFASASSPFRICVIARADIARPLTQIAIGQQAWGRPVVVSQMVAGGSLSQCQILFASSADSAAMAGLGSAPVLTVSDGQAGARSGVIQFVMDDGHVRFVIHRSEAESRRLQISSKLLSVAAAVVP